MNVRKIFHKSAFGVVGLMLAVGSLTNANARFQAYSIYMGVNTLFAIGYDNSNGSTGLYRWAGGTSWVRHGNTGGNGLTGNSIGYPLTVAVPNSGTPVVASAPNDWALVPQQNIGLVQYWWASSTSDNSTFVNSFNNWNNQVQNTTQILFGGFNNYAPYGSGPVPGSEWAVIGPYNSHQLYKWNATNGWTYVWGSNSDVTSTFSVDGDGNPWRASKVNSTQWGIFRYNGSTWIQQNFTSTNPLSIASPTGTNWVNEYSTWASDGVQVYEYYTDDQPWNTNSTYKVPGGIKKTGIFGSPLAVDAEGTPYVIDGYQNVWQRNFGNQNWTPIN